MDVNSVITLENDVNCLILEKVNYNGDNYFSAVVLNETELTDEYVVLKEIIEDNENYVEKVDNADLLMELLKLFTGKVKIKVDAE